MAANIEELKAIANQLRIDVIRSVYTVQSGHIGGSLSAADVVAALYFYKMNIDPKNPGWEDRDRFVLSKGHAGPVLYSACARRGYFEVEKLWRLRQIESFLQGAPKMIMPGADMSAGPLGQGISAAVGMALGARYLKKPFKTYCMMGDGEIQEGQVWEALMSAANFRLGNLVGILDQNKVQMNGHVKEIMEYGDISVKFEAFGWKVVKINGHDMEQIVAALDSIDDNPEDAPTMIVSETIKSKGVSFMEDSHLWHGRPPNDEQFAMAMQELGGTI